MSLPRSLRVLGRRFKIKYVDLISESPEDMGNTHGTQREITISLLQHGSESSIRTTLIHEYLHGALHVSGLGELMDARHEESLVTMLTHAFEEIEEQLRRIPK